MSSYLDIAEKVLELRRRPMGAHAILKEAYLLDFVPTHLHGETQHKTLHARVAEDIVRSRDRSRFVRTSPGKFFLRSLLTDESIPAEFRRTMTARRRKRQLTREPVLCVRKGSLNTLAKVCKHHEQPALERLRDRGDLAYFEYKSRPDDHVPIWAFVSLYRDDSILSYRMGRYRTDDDGLAGKRTVGFSSLITEKQQTLFNHCDLGVLEAGVTALSMDLDFPLGVETLEAQTSPVPAMLIIREKVDVTAVLLAYETKCPNWFEPTTKRLSMNDLKWLPFRVSPNYLDDFDNWTKALVKTKFAWG